MFVDQSIETKLAHPDQIPPAILEAIQLAYKVRQQHLTRFEAALDALLRLQEQAARFYHEIEATRRQIAALPADDYAAAEVLTRRIEGKRALAMEIERDIERDRATLISSRAAEYHLEVRI